jgi:hypothetical protein
MNIEAASFKERWHKEWDVWHCKNCNSSQRLEENREKYTEKKEKNGGNVAHS